MSLIQRECTPALSPSEGERENRRQLSGEPRIRGRVRVGGEFDGQLHRFDFRLRSYTVTARAGDTRHAASPIHRTTYSAAAWEPVPSTLWSALQTNLYSRRAGKFS